MANLFKIKMVYSTSHLLMPKIVVGILIILAVIMLVQEIIKRKKEGTGFGFKKIELFDNNYDKVKFWGALILFVAYIIALNIVGFLISSIVFVFLFNVLFAGTKDKKSLLASGIISIVSSTTIWYVFGFIFNVTLP